MRLNLPTILRLLSSDVIVWMALCFVYALVFGSVRVSVCEVDIKRREGPLAKRTDCLFEISSGQWHLSKL